MTTAPTLPTLDTERTLTLQPLTIPGGGSVAAQTVATRLTITGDADGPGGGWADLTLTNAELHGTDTLTIDAQQARELARVLVALADRLDALTGS
ncbi:hypothetical protein EBO23_04270 [Micrococcus luteus]|uniref:hypothetical protein n=1 Tax=Micrococcus luteus TaxID=1270 RepID=UPI00117201BB|nr:hypothetical protein [Micrococcus luteus]MCT2324951.1 hypothetical protein [Micrococcus luteus]TPE34994.1 hypothetical protein EBO23_04270 [Micrococcus luteus]